MSGWKHGCARCKSRTHTARYADRSGFGGPDPKPHYPPDLSLEPKHVAMDLAVDIASETLRGTVTTRVQARRDGVQDLRLHLVGAYDVHVQDPSGAALSFAYTGEEVEVRWESAFAREEERAVSITYRVTSPVDGLLFSAPDDAYPERARFAVTDHETERARYWYPCIDLPNVRVTLDITLRAAADLTLLAAGALQSETHHDDGTKSAHWVLDALCPSYITCFAIGDFVRFDAGEFEGIPVAYYAPKHFSAEQLEISFGRTKAMLSWITAKLDTPFPFPKYYQFAVHGIGGAMENISLVSWESIFVLNETLAQEWSWLVDQVNIHEMAHSYFGDLLVCRDFAHAWLKESWATYMETCWLEDNVSKEEGDFDFYRNVNSYIGEADSSYARPIVTRNFTSSWQMYDWHLYPGGASRLHMLRHELGSETFWTGVRSYVKRFASKVVETDNFRRTLEDASGRSLGKWFDQWIHSPGYPSMKVSFSYDADRNMGQFEIEQTQVDKEKERHPFAFSTELGWSFEDEHHTHTISIESARHVVHIPMKSDPSQVRFDALNRTVHKLDFTPSDAKLRAQWIAAPDIVGRCRAARALAKSGKRANLKALREHYAQQPFWGVRVECAKGLAALATQDAILILADLIRSEEDPMVLESLLRSVSKLRDPAIFEALTHRLDHTTMPLRAHAVALEMLAAQPGHDGAERFFKALETKTHHNIVESGALRALAKTRDTESIPKVLELVQYGALPERARPAAVSALGALGALLPQYERWRVREPLEDLLRDPAVSARRAAASALVTLGERGAIPALRAYRATVAKQDQPEVDDKISALRSSGDTPVKSLQDTIEKLLKQVQKLEHRVHDVESVQNPENVDKKSDTSGEQPA